MAKLKATVWVAGKRYRAGSMPPPDIAARITNPKAWVGDAPAVADNAAASNADEADARVRDAEARTKELETELETLREQLASRVPADTQKDDSNPSAADDTLAAVQEPPRFGAGSGADVWRAFLVEQGVEDVPVDATRGDLVALWDARKVQG